MEGQDSFVLFRGRHDTVSSLVSFHHVLHRQHSSIASSCPARSSSVSCLSPGILYAVVASVCSSVGSQSLDFRVSPFIFRLQAVTSTSFLIDCFRSTCYRLIKVHMLTFGLCRRIVFVIIFRTSPVVKTFKYIVTFTCIVHFVSSF